jgi:hypothetical protein
MKKAPVLPMGPCDSREDREPHHKSNASVNNGNQSDYSDSDRENQPVQQKRVEGHRRKKPVMPDSESDSEIDASERQAQSNGDVDEQAEGGESVEPSFMNTTITYYIGGSIESLSSTSPGNSSNCCSKISEIKLQATRNGKLVDVEGPQIIKSVDIIDINNRFGVSVAVLIEGIEAQQGKLKHTNSGVTAHSICYPMSKKKNVVEPVFAFDVKRGVQFMERFPGTTLETLKKGIHKISKKLYLVEEGHPLSELLIDMAHETGEIEAEQFKLVNGFYHVDAASAESLLDTIEIDMKKHMPLVELNQIKVRLTPAFPAPKTASDKRDIADDPWRNNLELQELSTAKKHDELKRQAGCYVTLRISHCPATLSSNN